MRKIRYLIVALLMCIVSLFSIGMVNSVNSVALSQYNVVDSSTKEEIIKELEDFIGLDDENVETRAPGSEAELKSAKKIKAKLDALSTFEPVNNQTIVDGVQTFEFNNIYLDKKMVSQNIVYQRKSNLETNKKVVIGAHYDTTMIFDENGNMVSVDGINDNAGGVAVLLAFIQNIDQELVDLGYNLEVVFFGASSSLYAGSQFYVECMTDSQAKDVLAMINLDRVAVGKHNYLYVNEFKTSQEQYVRGVLNGKVDVKRLKAINILDFSSKSANGFSYTHLGLESDHIYFMKRHINVINFFSGDYEKPLTFGLSEYEGKESITFTKNDSYSYIKENKIDVASNLMNIYKSLDIILFDESFVLEMEKDSRIAENTLFWNNDKLAVLISAIMLIIFCLIYYLIYVDLSKKSKKRAKEANIDAVVFKITQNIGEKDKDLNKYIDKKVKDDTETKDDKE